MTIRRLLKVIMREYEVFALYYSSIPALYLTIAAVYLHPMCMICVHDVGTIHVVYDAYG